MAGLVQKERCGGAMKSRAFLKIPSQIVIGKYRLIELDDPNKIWIGSMKKGREGEGGAFNMHDLAKVIEAFYRENF